MGIFKRAVRKFKRFFIKKNFVEVDKVDEYKKSLICSNNEFIKNMIYKDEEWNYIYKLQDYLQSMNNKKAIIFDDNQCNNKKYNVDNEKMIINTEKIKYNWICFFYDVSKEYKNYELTYKVKLLSEFEEIQVAFNYKDLGNRYRFMIRNNNEAVFECVKDGKFYNELFKKDFKLELNKEHEIKVCIYNDLFSYYIDGELVYCIKAQKQYFQSNRILLIFYNKDEKRNVACEVSDVNIYSIEKE